MSAVAESEAGKGAAAWQQLRVSAALDLAESEFGAPVDVAVNCAGIGIASRTLGREEPHSLSLFQKFLFAPRKRCEHLWHWAHDDTAARTKWICSQLSINDQLNSTSNTLIIEWCLLIMHMHFSYC